MRSLAVVCIVAGLARADGAIVFARGGQLMAIADSGKGDPVVLGTLPAGATVHWIEATADGSLIVLDLGTAPPMWQKLDGQGALHTMACSASPAHPSPKGECVVCQASGKQTLVATASNVTLALPGSLEGVTFLGTTGTDLAAVDAGTVVGFDRRKPDVKKILAVNGLAGHFLPSPDGTKAVAVFGDKDAARIRSFVLDGQGVSRQLGGPGIPTVWSWDSTWVIDQEGDDPNFKYAPDEGMLDEAPPDRFLLGAPSPKGTSKPPKPPPPPPPPPTRACVVRATGGEVKCWDGFEGEAFSPDSTRVLLKQFDVVYVGTIAGVHPDPPTKIVDKVDGAATWIPIMPAAMVLPVVAADDASAADDAPMIWLALLADLAATQPTTRPAPVTPVTIDDHHDVLFASVRFDAGHDFDYGLSAIVARSYLSTRGGLGVMGWYGGGLEARIATRDHTRLDGFIVDVPLRFSFMGDAGGFGMELTAGVGGGPGTSVHGVGSVGAFIGLYYLDIGYSYQFPLGPFDRPDWMASHMFSVRLQIPTYKWNAHEATRR